MQACIVGWSHTPFGRFDSQSGENLIAQAATDALADAGGAPGDVDETAVANYVSVLGRLR